MKPLNFEAFPQLQTRRLQLRQLNMADDTAIFFLRSDPEVNKYIARTLSTSLEDAKAFILKINNGIAQKESLYWAICLDVKEVLVGTICLWNFSDDGTTAEIGYELHPVYHGKGIMNEALQEVLHYGFQTLCLQSVEAFTHHQNERSIYLLLQNKFKLAPLRIDEDNPDNAVYILQNNNY